MGLCLKDDVGDEEGNIVRLIVGVSVGLDVGD